jgi:hypothetical protein
MRGRQDSPGAQGTGCTVGEVTVGRSMRGLQLANRAMAVTLLPDKGADIYQLIYRPAGMDVLWKSPWGLREPGIAPQSAASPLAAFLDSYGGGWQVLFPNGGAACEYRGAELGFHGEATLASWSCEITDSGGAAAEARLSTRLRRSPFRLERTVRIEGDRPVLIVRERIVNEGREPLDYMWSHHPAFGAPFLSGACRIDIPARSLLADDGTGGPPSVLAPGARYSWPVVPAGDVPLDLSQVPGQGAGRAILAYFGDFQAGWYAITNTQLGFGVGLTWPTDVFPYAWFWQELHASPGYPWYKGVYVMAIEPATSIPGQGLQAVIAKTGTQRTLDAGASVEAEIRAVFYESSAGVQRIDPDGSVVAK